MPREVKRVRRKRRVKSLAPSRSGLFTKRNALFVVTALIGFVFGYLSLAYAPRAYNSWREGRLLKHASALLEKNDFAGATQTAQQMLKLRPASLPAFQILADATEKQNRAETVAWRSQIARALPHNLDAQLNLASAALRFGQLDTARHALDNVPPRDRDKAAYHVVAGWLARAQGDEKAVEQHFAAALEREPANETYQFNLAVLRILSPDLERSAEARAALERLSKVPGFHAGALRALLSDAVAHNDLARADTLAQELQMTQQITFADYLLCLDFYRKLDEKKFSAVLEKIKPVAERNQRDLALLMDWMVRNGLASEVLEWSEKLPAETKTAPPAAISIAEAFAEVKNWSRLKRWTRSGSWGKDEYLRLAYQAYASRQAKQSAASAEFNSLWSSAERSAADNPDRVATLARLAMKWNLPSEAEHLWQRVIKNAPMRREALDALAGIYRANNDLRPLLQVAKQLHESSPGEVTLTANYARLALLIEPNTEEAQRLAKEAYEAAPADVNCAVTYAFALYGLGRTGEGIAVLSKLPHEQLLDPHSAVYAAVLLIDDNRAADAQEFIAAAKKGEIFPEEKKLLEEAVNKANAAAAAAAAAAATATSPAPAASPPPSPPPSPSSSPSETPAATPSP